STGAIGSDVYSIVVAMAIVTTLIVPPFLPSLVRRTSNPLGSAGGSTLSLDDGAAESVDGNSKD
ncbi:MAG TPA: hypothetical protein VI277_03645, partial [Candidatus Limnocylindria bacterium]